MSALRQQFGKRVRVLRKQADLSQEHLAARADISVDFLSLMERGINAPSFETLEKLAQALDVEVADLFNFGEGSGAEMRGEDASDDSVRTSQVKKVDSLSPGERKELARELIQEQVIDARRRLHRWRDFTDQPAQVDTGYVAQHLVSLVVGVRGDRMRGKGIDLLDESEIKGANFLDSLDKRGAVAPRWNFPSNDENTMMAYVQVPTIYLVCFDWNAEERIRARVWALDPD